MNRNRVMLIDMCKQAVITDRPFVEIPKIKGVRAYDPTYQKCEVEVERLEIFRFDALPFDIALTKDAQAIVDLFVKAEMHKHINELSELKMEIHRKDRELRHPIKTAIKKLLQKITNTFGKVGVACE